MSAAIKEKTDVVTLQPVQSNALTPMDMIRDAAARGDMEVVTKLMDLQDRWQQTEARKLFNEAFAAFKTEVLPVVRNKLITDGPLKGKRYADLYSFVQAVTPALSKNGLSASWDIVRDDKDWIEVACTIEHVQGHTRRVKMGGPPDTGGAKNPIQARVSAVSYLERQTLKAVCGIAEQGDDDDAASRDTGEVISQEQADKIKALIVEHGRDLSRFLKWAKVEHVEDIRAIYYQSCVDTITGAGK